MTSSRCRHKDILLCGCEVNVCSALLSHLWKCVILMVVWNVSRNGGWFMEQKFILMSSAKAPALSHLHLLCQTHTQRQLQRQSHHQRQHPSLICTFSLCLSDPQRKRHTQRWIQRQRQRWTQTQSHLLRHQPSSRFQMNQCSFVQNLFWEKNKFCYPYQLGWDQGKKLWTKV